MEILIGLILFGLVFFILTAISTAKMAKDYGIKDSFLAYIPFSQQYMQGKVADAINKQNNEWSLYQLLYPILTAITIIGYGFLLVAVLTFDIPIITSDFADLIDSSVAINTMIYLIVFTIISLICLIYLVVLYKCHFIIFNEYDTKHAVLYLMLSIFFNIHPILLYMIKDKKTNNFGDIFKQNPDDNIEMLSAEDVEIIPHVNPAGHSNDDSLLDSIASEDIARNLSYLLDENEEE